MDVKWRSGPVLLVLATHGIAFYTGIQMKLGSPTMKTAFDGVHASLHQQFESSFTFHLHFSPAILHLEVEHNKVECF